MGAKAVWQAVAAERMGEPVLAGAWVGRKGVIAKGVPGALVGQLAGTVGGVVGEIVEGAVSESVKMQKEHGDTPSPTRPATLIPIPDYAYLAVGQTKLGLFRFDRGAFLPRHALKETIFIIPRTPDMALHLNKRGIFYGKLTLLVPGYLPTPVIAPSRFWKDLTRTVQALGQS
jgi:hypothetical protein